MCGIAGAISTPSKTLTDELENALEQIRHRGPDDRGRCEYSTSNTQVVLGHNRLSIIDLSENGHQPFNDPSGNYSLVFNGEIYNFKELKLLLPDVVFTSDSDTEVLLHLYIKYGAKALDYLEGMFAFAILDRVNGEVFLARDPLGIKPLYFHESEKQIVFASEIKALFEFSGIEKKIDENLIEEFLLNGFLYEPDTGFLGIKKLAAGHWMKISLKQPAEVQISQYWSVASTEATDKPLAVALEKSINDHMVSDAPLGVFFSGGIDSSLILSQMHEKVMPIVARYGEEEVKASGIEDDFYYSKRIAEILGQKLSIVEFDEPGTLPDGFFKNLEAVARDVEELTSDFTFTAAQLLSRKARESGYKVMLSGMGGDELFAGYPRYKLVKYAKWFRFLLPFVFLRNFIPRLKQNKKLDRFVSFFRASDFGSSYTSTVGVFSREEVNELLGGKTGGFLKKITRILRPVENWSALKKAMYLDLSGFLAHNFIVADKSSMQESIELRVPLATAALARQSFALPDDVLIKGGVLKYPLKKMLETSLPKEMIYRPKTGFNPPLDGLVRNLGVERIKAYFIECNLYDFLQEGKVETIVNTHFSKQKNETYKIYNLLFLATWLKINR